MDDDYKEFQDDPLLVEFRGKNPETQNKQF
jgi:hypothetical protein